MIQKNALYLKTSIFYHSDSWHTLMGEGLRPFIKRYPDNPCNIRINNEQGDNIRFAIAMDSTEYKMIAGELHQHLHNFLQDRPCRTDVAPCIQSLFIDFPTNSVRYNLFDHIPFLIEDRNKVLNIDDFIAEFWKVLINTEMTVLEQIFKNRFVFSTQLFVTLLFCFSKDGRYTQRILEYLRNHFREKDFTLTKEVETQYDRSLGDVSKLIAETIGTLQSPESNNHFLTPVKKLFDKLAKTTTSLKEIPRSRFFYQFLKRLNNDLGIPEDAIIFYVLKNYRTF